MNQSTTSPSTSASPAVYSSGAPKSFAEMTQLQRLGALAALDLSRSIRTFLFGIPFFLATIGLFFLVCINSSLGKATMVIAFGSMPLSLVAVPRMTAQFLRSELQSLSLDPSAAAEISRKFKGIDLRTTRQRKAASQLESG